MNKQFLPCYHTLRNKTSSWISTETAITERTFSGEERLGTFLYDVIKINRDQLLWVMPRNFFYNYLIINLKSNFLNDFLIESSIDWRP